MDRVIVQPAALPQDTDILLSNKFAMLGQAYQNMALLGTSTVVAGLAATPTSPTADLHVTIGAGTIYQMDPTDASAYGSAGVDNTNVMKQGINATPQVLSIAPPATSGFSQVYLVQAILNNVDGGVTVENYYNSAQPSQPFSGPNNSGTSNFTIRSCNCVIALKAGVAASTGTQVGPAPDAGYTALYYITVANGQTQITSANISLISTAPFFPTLPSVPAKVQAGTWLWGGSDTGTANNYVITCSPIPTAYAAGMCLRFKASNANSGASQINVNGLGNVAIKRAGGNALATGDIVSGQVVSLVYDGVNFQMDNYLGVSGSQTITNNTVGLPYVVDSGTQNALVGTYSPAITSYTAGLAITIKLANAITTASTINVNGLGLKSVTLGDGSQTTANQFSAGQILLLIYDGTQFQVYGTSASVAKKLTGNYTLYVNQGVGNDANDGSANISGKALATIGKAMQIAWAYGPSQYTITIQVSAGTYNEAVATPLQAGPNVVINGSGVNATTVNGGTANTFTAQGPNTLTVQNLNGTNTGGISNWVFGAQQGAVLNTFNTQSGNQSGNVFESLSGATVNPGNHNFNGNQYSCFAAVYGGTMFLNTYTYTFLGPVAVTDAVVSAFGNGVIAVNNVNPPTFGNPSYVNGKKFDASVNGVIALDGLGANFLPGSVPGTVNGGQFYP
ncbi:MULTISPECIES: hypothetical protein [unclassified Bradyrhizobium]|uniref:hypothetical protein n=1 Tax=unclassified Bradyrhizobium TaxID=2631580 RepID=UPI0028E9FAFD|nr:MULTISPECIES: hypothetical protein [unclassified Bradyrhizobium]